LAHQYPSTSDSYAPLVEDLLGLGVATLAFDLRGHGRSIQSPSGPLVIDTPLGFTPDAFGQAFMSSAGKVGFSHISDDIVRVAGWGAVQNFIDSDRLLLFGASVGGTGVLLAAPRVTPLRGLVTLGAAGAPAHGPDAGLQIRRALENTRVPTLLTSSANDPFEGANNAHTWGDGLSHVQVQVVPGSDHAMAIYYLVRDSVLAVVRRVLGR
ncbi:MAG TPA: alpha/beta fold hydrolase, partial [Gemmatimonadales bacterium]|nr:alpha/beta fold hydrolase [Gemmatimonadales bacterium]